MTTLSKLIRGAIENHLRGAKECEENKLFETSEKFKEKVK
jgi:hypothetical protein